MSLDVWLEIDELDTDESVVFSANITHNLRPMAIKAGLQHIWTPEELNIRYAGELIIPLTEGYKELTLHPDIYKQLDSPNGWGTYADLCRFVQKYLFACIKYPTATIRIWR